MYVRPEEPSDVDPIRQVVAAAFADPATPDRFPAEARLVDALRADDGWIPMLSLVATDPGSEVVGHVVCTRATIAGAPALGLGPLAVRPDWQRRGVGIVLMQVVLRMADALDESVVCLLGSPAFYGRFGFRPAFEGGIVAPDPAWGEHFQFRRLSAYRRVTGTFAYAAPFNDL